MTGTIIKFERPRPIPRSNTTAISDVATAVNGKPAFGAIIVGMDGMDATTERRLLAIAAVNKLLDVIGDNPCISCRETATIDVMAGDLAMQHGSLETAHYLIDRGIQEMLRHLRGTECDGGVA